MPALVAEILISAAEIRPANLRRYGAVAEETAEELERVSARLSELCDTLETAIGRAAPGAPREDLAPETSLDDAGPL